MFWSLFRVFWDCQAQLCRDLPDPVPELSNGRSFTLSFFSHKQDKNHSSLSDGLGQLSLVHLSWTCFVFELKIVKYVLFI